MSLRSLSFEILAALTAFVPLRHARTVRSSVGPRRGLSKSLPPRPVPIGWVVVGFAALTLCPIAYAGWLTSDWTTLLACAPAILVLLGLFAGLVGAICEARAMISGATKSEAERQPAARDRSPQLGLDRPTPSSSHVNAYNERKIKGILSWISEIPEKHTRKKKRPQEIAYVVEPNCTGCGVCIPFCPVDCIELESAKGWPNRTIPPVRIRYDECIGCEICVRVCEKLAWDATVMRPTEAIEREEGIVIHDTPIDLDRLTSGF